MVFSSIIFLFMFLPLFLICYFIPKKIKTKNIILLIFSLIFYAWGEPYYLFLMIFMIIVNYFLAISMHKNKKILFFSIIFNLLSLLSFKYLNFFIDNLNNIFHLSFNKLTLSLPIGISFYTFQIISYLIDVYKEKVPVQKNFIKFACYVSAFPQLIAGPIVRYVDIEKNLNQRNTTYDDLYIGFQRFIIGLSKKVLIANNVSYVCDNIFNLSYNDIGFIGIIIAIITYSLQIYFDFSGYSDMAIGLGRICGFKYNENFDLPYKAKNITDFWRRWHISLSSFFRDYLYIPLGGNRVSKIKHIRNIIIVWTLTGLWHGDSWNYIIWGLYYGIILIIEKYLLKNKCNNKIYRILTILFICIGWLIFRQTNSNDLLNSFKALFGGYGLGNINSLYYLGIFSIRFIVPTIVGIIISFNCIKIKNSIFKDIILLIMFVLSIISIVVNSYNPFIYYRF